MLCMRELSHVCETPRQSSAVKETVNSCSKLNNGLTFFTQTKAAMQETDSTNEHGTQHPVQQLKLLTVHKHTTTSCFPLSFFSLCHPFFLSLYTWCNLISSQNFSLCLSVFSSNTFHKWQGERYPLKVIACLIKFPPPRKEQESVIKEKRRELERINLPCRPSTPRPCPSISDEENEKFKRILKKAETGWQVRYGDGNRSNTGVMRNRRDEREVRKRNERMTGGIQ